MNIVTNLAHNKPIRGAVIMTAAIALLITVGLASAQTPPSPTPTPIPSPTATIPPTYTPQIDVPPADPAFSTPQALGPGTRNYSEFPQMVAERDGSLSVVWDWGERDRLLYIHSTDQGQTWTPAQTIAGNPAWGGAVGNQTLVADSQGNLDLGSWELYGSTYPHVTFRRRTADGVWQPGLIAPNSVTYRMKGIVVGLDTDQLLTLAIVGKGAQNLGLYATDGTQWSWNVPLPLTTTSYPNPVWLPAVATNNGQMLAVWGDYRLGQYNMWSAWAADSISGSSTLSWQTYAFTDTFPDGQSATGTRQYTVRLQPLLDGGIAAAYEGRDPDSDQKDIYYREWNPAKYGTAHGGWQQYPVRIATTPIPSEAPFICMDGRGQRYVFWQDFWNNLRIVYTYSADGITWHPIQRVNAGPYSREKHPQCAISGDKLAVVWDDHRRMANDEYALAYIYFATRPLPDLYPLPATPTPTPVASVTPLPHKGYNRESTSRIAHTTPPSGIRDTS